MKKNLRFIFMALLCAVFSTAWGGEVTFTAGTDTGESSVTKDGITVSMSTMSETDNYRTYANTNMTVSSDVGNITKIEITCTGSGDNKYGPGNFSFPGNSYSYSGTKGTWTGSAKTVSLSASAQVRMTSITVTVTEAISSDALFYEGLSAYSGKDGTNSITNSYANLDAKWSDISNVYAGGDLNAYANGGCLKFSSSKSNGSMTTSSINLKGSGKLTYYLKKYGTDSGKLNITVTGAKAEGDVNETAQNEWTQYTVNLSEATGAVTIKFSATNRIYVDEILIEKGENKTVIKPTFSPEEGTFTEAQNVTISTTTEGATIYYTTDGSDPSTASSVYSTPVNITVTGTTLKAIAVKDGMTDSRIASATYIIKPKAPTITSETNTVTITADAGLNIYYTIDGSDPTKASTLYSAPFAPERSCTVKAIAYDAYDNASDVTELVITLPIIHNPKNINSNYFVKVTSVDELEDGDAILIVNEDVSVAMSTEQRASNRGSAEVTITDNIIDGISNDVQKIVLVEASDAQTEDHFFGFLYTGDGYLYAASNSANHLKTEDVPDEHNNAKFDLCFTSGDASIKFQGDNLRNDLRYNSSNDLFSCYSSGQSAVQIYKEVEKIEDVTITFAAAAEGYATLYYGDRNLTVPAGVKAYAFQIDDNGKGTKLTPSYNVIPKGVGVLLELEDKSSLPVEKSFSVSDTPDAVVGGNMLYGTDTEQMIVGETGYQYYKLTTKGGTNVGFYFGSEDGAPFKNGAHKAYLKASASSTTASAYVFDDTNDIQGVSITEKTESTIYTISGMRMNGENLPAGLYIVNGKKMIIK